MNTYERVMQVNKLLREMNENTDRLQILQNDVAVGCATLLDENSLLRAQIAELKKENAYLYKQIEDRSVLCRHDEAAIEVDVEKQLTKHKDRVYNVPPGTR